MRWFLLLLVAACGTNDVRQFNNTYIGILDDCYPDQYVIADVFDGHVHIPLPFRRDLDGTVSPDGDLSGSEIFPFSGHISGKMFGYTMTVQVHDDRCDLDLVLAPKQGT